jgi:protein-tyrosine-phosphatase
MAWVTDARGPPDAHRRLPGAVLFACNLNRVRSPMAAGLMKRLFGQAVFIDSCGLRAARPRRGDPDDGADAFAIAVMDELGVDLTDHHPKTFDDLEDTSFDVAISLTPEAHHRAVELARRQAIDIEYWPTFDPALVSGGRETMLQAYRDVRDGLEARLRARFGEVRTFGG